MTSFYNFFVSLNAILSIIFFTLILLVSISLLTIQLLQQLDIFWGFRWFTHFKDKFCEWIEAGYPDKTGKPTVVDPGELPWWYRNMKIKEEKGDSHVGKTIRYRRE